MEFNPSRLVLARKRLGLSKTALAEKSAISVRSLGYYESSDVEPSEEHLSQLARVLELPVEFFSGPDIEEINCDAASFRALSRLTASQRDSAVASGSFAKMVSDWIENKFDLPAPSVPSLRDFEPEAAAQVLRTEWGLGERPIVNIVHLLESRGVRVFSLPVDSLSVDAFSTRLGKTLFVFLNTKKSAEHTRFDAGHELGHLTLHTHGVTRSRDAELEADRFGSAFLMPRGDILGHVPPPSTITVKTIHRLKKRWGVSAIALVFRLHKLRVISDWQYRNLCIELSGDGYRTSERDGGKRDTSQVLAKVFSKLREKGITRGTIARELKLTPAIIDSFLVGLVIAAVASPNGSAPRKTSVAPTAAESTLKAV